MEKLSNWIEKTMYPIAEWVQSNKYLAAIQRGLLMSMPLLLVGAFACIISDFPVQGFQNLMISIFGEQVWYGWNWGVVNLATIGLLGFIVLVGTSYELAKRNEVEGLTAVTIALMSYFTLLHVGEDGGFAAANFGAQGMFLAILVAVISGEIYSFCIRKNIILKMPESVPSFVAKQFSAIIPGVICCILFLVIRYIIGITEYGTASALIYGLLQEPLTKIGTSLPGVIISNMVNSILWFFGIHGTEVVAAVMGPLSLAAQSANLQVFQMDPSAVRPYIATYDFSNMIMVLGGTGITIPLCVQMAFFCKSKRMNSIGKLSLVPGIFNVNEPVIFGLPLVMNPIMFIPFMLAPMASVLIGYVSMLIGLVPYPTGVTVPWTLPAPLGGWLMCNDWRGGALQIVILIVAGVIYYPFVKILDKKYVEEESLQEKD